MVDPIGSTYQASEILATSSDIAAPTVASQVPEFNCAGESAPVDLKAVEEQIALATLLLMNQELSRSRLQLEQRLQEAHQEEA